MTNYQNYLLNIQSDDSSNQFIPNKYDGAFNVLEKLNNFNKKQLNVYESFADSNEEIILSYRERLGIDYLLEGFIYRLKKEEEKEILEYSNFINEDFTFDEFKNSLMYESWKNKIKNSLKDIAATTSKFANKSLDKTINSVDDVKKWAKEKIESVKEKYANLIKFLNDLIKSGISTIKDFITKIAQLFEKLGDTLSVALQKLGAFNEEKDEEDANIKVDDAFLKVIPDNQQSFFKHVVAYIYTMTGSQKEKVDKLVEEDDNFVFDFNTEEINEGLIDKIANNKVLQFILCYGKGKKISFWKTILVSIVGSLIITFGLPIVLNIIGVGSAAGIVVMTAVSIIWQVKGILKVLLNRYVNKKEDENFFDKTTTIALIFSVLPLTLLKIPAVKEGFIDTLEWLFKHLFGVEGIFGDITKDLGDKIGDILGDVQKHFNGSIPENGKLDTIFDYIKTSVFKYSEIGAHMEKDMISKLTQLGVKDADKIADSVWNLDDPSKIISTYKEAWLEFGNPSKSVFMVNSTGKSGTLPYILKAFKYMKDQGKLPISVEDVIKKSVFVQTLGTVSQKGGSKVDSFQALEDIDEKIIEGFKDALHHVIPENVKLSSFVIDYIAAKKA